MIKNFLPASYKIPTDPNKTAGLHKTIKVKKDMLIKLCNNYVISNGLVNGSDGLFKATTSCNNKSYIWIYIFNSKVGITTRFSNLHLYKELDIESTWTPIGALAKEIRTGKKSNPPYNTNTISYSTSCSKNHSSISRIVLR
jgi:hypothetical protein